MKTTGQELPLTEELLVRFTELTHIILTIETSNIDRSATELTFVVSLD